MIIRPTLRAALTVLLAATAVAAGPPPGRARADEAVKAPYEWVRALRRQQEKVAHGSMAAQTAQLALLAQAGTTFIEAEPAVWRDPRNARAAALYLFSGGKPAVIRTVLSRSTMPQSSDRLVKGALAYAEGQDQIARDLLAPIDPRAEPSGLGGQLALVEATLLATTDPQKAKHFLELARLLVPGSLVEEAALRRQISLESGPESLGRFVTLSRQYLHHFPASIYAQNFKQHFAAAALEIGSGGDVAPIARLDPAIVEFPVAEQRAIYLAIAKAAIVKGQVVAARYAASRAATIATDAATDGARAKLYLDAAAIVGDDVARGVAALEAADGTRLPPEDAEFREGALAVARSVQAPVPDPADGVAGAADPEAATTVEQATKALKAGTALLDQVK